MSQYGYYYYYYFGGWGGTNCCASLTRVALRCAQYFTPPTTVLLPPPPSHYYDSCTTCTLRIAIIIHTTRTMSLRILYNIIIMITIHYIIIILHYYDVNKVAVCALPLPPSRAHQGAHDTCILICIQAIHTNMHGAGAVPDAPGRSSRAPRRGACAGSPCVGRARGATPYAASVHVSDRR